MQEDNSVKNFTGADFTPPHTDKSVIEKVTWPAFDSNGISLFFKREDLIHPIISGNKWRKLKGYLSEYERTKAKGIISFGGAYSNHLYALAYVGVLYNIPTAAIIRGEELQQKNQNLTLQFLSKCNMQLHFVPRSDYRLKIQSQLVQSIIDKHDSYLLIPEGGEGVLGEAGCAEIITAEEAKEYDYICLCVGTGTTLIGLAKTHSRKKILGFMSVKSHELADKLQTRLPAPATLIGDYTFGGFAKSTPELVNFCKEFSAATHIPVEPVYTGKMVYGLADMAKKGFFRKGEKILTIHTGGLRHWDNTTF